MRDAKRPMMSSLPSWSSTLSDCVTCEGMIGEQASSTDTVKERTTRRTDFFEDSCISPAMISSSRIYTAGRVSLLNDTQGTESPTAYAFWKLKMLPRNTRQMFHDEPSTRRLTGPARTPKKERAPWCRINGQKKGQGG